MAEEKFSDNLWRMLAAELHFSNAMVAAREMFGRSYFSLGAGEKAAVDHAVFANVQGNYQAITPRFLASQTTKQPMGFRAPQTSDTSGSS
jgi:hypothetical protein